MAGISDKGWDLGGYLREQREHARLSVRQLATLAGVSNPYLSQVERGLRKPSAEVLQQIARGLRISAEALYVRAGILDSEGRPDVEAAVNADPDLNDRQRRVLLDIYASFRAENRRAAHPEPPPAAPADAAAAGGAEAGGAEAGGAEADAAVAGEEPPGVADVVARPVIRKRAARRAAKAAPTAAAAAAVPPADADADAAPVRTPRKRAAAAAKRATSRSTRSARSTRATRAATAAEGVAEGDPSAEHP